MFTIKGREGQRWKRLFQRSVLSAGLCSGASDGSPVPDSSAHHSRLFRVPPYFPFPVTYPIVPPTQSSLLSTQSIEYFTLVLAGLFFYCCLCLENFPKQVRWLNFFRAQGMWMWLPWLIISLIFCSFTALSTPSLQQEACVLCTMGNAMTKCIFQRWWHHCISHPTYSSSNVIVMVHQGMVRAWEDTCNCLASKCSRGDII